MKKSMLVGVAIIIMFIMQCGQKASISLENNDFAPGQEIKVNFAGAGSFSENAWIGIIPSDVPHGNEEENDAHDITYQYLDEKASGVLEFYAPGKPGSYDFRMHNTDDNGKEVASFTFTVTIVKEGATLKLNKFMFAPGEEIRLSFTAPAVYGPRAWIGIIPSDVPHGSEEENDQHDIEYQYLEKRTQGLLIFEAPEEMGSYDFRMHDTDDNGNEIISIKFEVE